MRKNRYTGVLRPVAVGRGSPEVAIVLIYDIEDDRLRTRTAEICMDYGLQRIQFSAFFGKLNRNRRQELALRIVREVAEKSARVRIYPICEDDLKDAWKLEQYRCEVGEVAAPADPSPKLKILPAGED